MSDSQENTENCKLKAFEKNNYFYGKLMTVRDFVLEQQYVNDKRWLINNLLFGSGTVCGLNVSSDGINIVVNSGFAIDKCGREIILPENVSLTLADKDRPSLNSKKSIYITYKECPKERVRAQTASTCDEVCANNRTEESYDFEIRDTSADGSDLTNEELCGIWTNQIIDIEAPYGDDKFRFKRKTKKYVSPGDLFEIYLEITNLNNSSSSSSIPLITDTLPPGLTLVEGGNSIGGTIPFGETIKKWYVVKVDDNPPANLPLKPKIDNNQIIADSVKSIIQVKSPREISETLFNELIDLRTKPCLEDIIDSGVKIAELSLGTDGSIIADNTKRKLVNNNKNMTIMLECLRVQARALEEQTIGIKNKLAPSNITLSATPTVIDADGVSFSTITITVGNNAGVALPDIYVNLISTLGKLLINNDSKTGADGTFTATLSGSTSGNATLIATTGIGTATMQIKFNSINGNIEGYVKVKDAETDTFIKGATVSVGTITATTNENGYFLLENVPPGKQVVWAFADRYEEGSCRVDVPTGKTASNTNIFLTLISTTGEIDGRVLDKAGNVIGSKVQVTAGGITTTADETGIYRLSNVPAGNLTVTASAEGYQSQNRSSVVVTDGKTTSGIDFRLEAATGTIQGVVTTSSVIIKPVVTGAVSLVSGRTLLDNIKLPILTRAIPGALVTVVGTTLSAITDELGNYIIKNVPLGTQTVSVSAENYNASTSSIFVEEETKTLNFQLTTFVTTGTVTGRVTTLRRQIVQPKCTGALPAIVAIDPGLIKAVDTTVVRPLSSVITNAIDTTIVKPIDTTIVKPIDINIGPILCVSGAPSNLPMEEIGIAGATVTVAGRSAVTDANGNYSIQNVPSGSQDVSASSAGYVAQNTTVLVAAGGTVTANFQLVIAVSRGTISGRVTKYTAIPLILCLLGGPGTTQAFGIKGVAVSVAGTALSAVTDDSGYYSISGVPTGTYTVNASAQGYNAGTQGATVNENLTTTVNFQLVLLPTTGEISGRVTNTSGTPIVSAGVNLVEVGDSVVTDASGTYRFPNARPGSHTVNVTAAGYISSSRTVSVNAGQITSADFVLSKQILCLAGGPNILCIVGGPGNIDICTGAKPSIVESCISGGPSINTPIIATPVVNNPIIATPIVNNPIIATPVVNNPIIATPVVNKPVVTPFSGNLGSPISKTAGAGTACPVGRPSIAPKTDTQPQVKTKKGTKK